MQKVDKEGNVTKEYIDFVEKLNRDDLERFYMGVDFLKDELQQRINKAIEYIEKHIVATETENILLEILKGEDKKLRW